MAIAFFDLDRTLIAANSGWLWIRREINLGRLSRWRAAWLVANLAQYQLGVAPGERALNQALRSLTGLREDELRDRMGLFYQEEVRLLFRPGAMRALEQHRQSGDRCVLLTSSPLYLAERVVDELSLDGALCNQFEVNDSGCYTGRTQGTLCFGKGKLEYAERYAANAKALLADCAFYTDSYTDFPVLQAVGRPVAVNPDRRLRKAASRLGWQIVDWGAPT